MKRPSMRIVSAMILLSLCVTALAQDQKPAERIQPPNPGFLGGKFAPVEGDIAAELGLEEQDGVAVMEVIPQSPAEKAGLQVKDVLKKIDDTEIDTVDTFRQVMRNTKPGQTLKMLILRDAEQKTVSVTLGQRPKDFNSGATTQPTTKPG